MEDTDLKVYFLASLLATPTNTGSSSSVLSSTKIVSISLPFPFPFPVAFSDVDFLVILGFGGLVDRVEALRGIRWGLRVAADGSMTMGSSDELC